MKEWIAKKSKEEGYYRSRLPSFTKEEVEMVKGEFSGTKNKLQLLKGRRHLSGKCKS
jgi:hypothetical protein